MAEFPECAPQYPQSTIVSIDERAAGAMGGDTTMITLLTQDAPRKVMAFYRTKMKASGVPLLMDTVMPGGGLLGVGEADDCMEVVVTIAQEGKQTSITIVVAPTQR